MSQKIQALSKKLSWLLRHGANESKLAMDTAGWVKTQDVMDLLALDHTTLQAVVDENTKARLQVEGDRMRAVQGHSPSGTPVTCDGLEASWVRYEGKGPLWHGTSREALPAIEQEGIKAMERTHVHLAETTTSKVGKRANVDVLLEVNPECLAVFISPNGVLLTRAVPVTSIVASYQMPGMIRLVRFS